MGLQRAADRNDMKGFCNGLKAVWGPKKEGPVHLKSTDGMETFSNSKRVVARWGEHFQKSIQRPWRHRSRSALPRQASMRLASVTQTP